MLQPILIAFTVPNWTVFTNCNGYLTEMTKYFVDYKTEEIELKLLMCGRFTNQGIQFLDTEELIIPQMVLNLACNIQIINGPAIYELELVKGDLDFPVNILNLNLSHFPIWTGPLHSFKD